MTRPDRLDALFCANRYKAKTEQLTLEVLETQVFRIEREYLASLKLEDGQADRIREAGLMETVSVPEGKSGAWTVRRFTIEALDIMNLRMSLDGRGCRPGTYTQLIHDRRGVVMSDTTAEQRDHTEFEWKARGHVLINGLGLGMCLAAALNKPEVAAVTVVEIDADVIALVGSHYADSRVQIVHASAFEYEPPKGIRYGAVWHDIWDSICADNLVGMRRLHRKYGRRADWQGSWARWRCEKAQKESREYALRHRLWRAA